MKKKPEKKLESIVKHCTCGFPDPNWIRNMTIDEYEKFLPSQKQILNIIMNNTDDDGFTHYRKVARAIHKRITGEL